MKKRMASKVFLGSVIVFSLVAMLNFTSALYLGDMAYSVQNTITTVTNALTPFFQALFGSYNSTEFLFAKVLLFFMLIIIINAVLKKAEFFKDSKGTVQIISIVIPILSIRFLEDNQLINGILLPYGALGLGIMTILPLLIFFFFIHTTNMAGFGRRICWIFFIIIFLVLWNSRYDSIGELGNRIYGWTTVFVIAAFLFDRNVHNYFRTWELNIFYRKANQRTIAALQSEYINILHLTTADGMARREEIKRHLKALGASLP